MSQLFDCTQAGPRSRGLERARRAISAGELVVLPTDSGYAVACDAFSPGGVDQLTMARGRRVAPPVFVPHARTLDGIAAQISPQCRDLAETFWPGGLTLVCHAQPTLMWDLGGDRSRVAVRMPLHAVALELLEATGPLAATGAHLAGGPPAGGCDQAQAQLGESVACYLDAGPCAELEPSTVVDTTGERPVLLRSGAIGLDRLREVVPDLQDLAAPVG